jgi:hypothetical protein
MMHDDREPGGRDDGPVDLSALLGGRRSPERWEALAARIEAAAAPELARRGARAGRTGLVDGVVTAVARFARPVLVAAAAAIVIAVGASRGGDAAPADAVDLVASAETLSEVTVQQALGAQAADTAIAEIDALVRAMYGDGAGGGDQE